MPSSKSIGAMAGVMALCMQLTVVVAATVEVPVVPFVVSDLEGNSLASDQIKQTEPWVLVVVSANQKSSTDLLSKLERKEGDWANRLTIVVSGNQKEVAQLAQQNNKLVNVRWYRDADGSIMQNLGLSGWPALMGIIPGDFIAWRSVGVPAQAPEAQSLVSSWIGLTTRP